MGVSRMMKNCAIQNESGVLKYCFLENSAAFGPQVLSVYIESEGCCDSQSAEQRGSFENTANQTQPCLPRMLSLLRSVGRL